MLPPLLIAGPTASGKSALAVAIAREVGGVVINADSMQVYAELRVLTARPSDDELAQAPHALYGHVTARRAYSVALWLRDVEAALGEAVARRQVPIIVGGTGLYFKALLEGLSPIPEIPADVRTHWRAEGARVGAEPLHRLLGERDPVMAARLAPGDTQRIVRALEVLEATGLSLAQWQSVPGTPLIDAERTRKIVVMPEREALYARADARFDLMMRSGALDEVRGLAAMDLDPALPVIGALGVRSLMAHLAGGALEEAVAAGKLETRHFIKRQQTWARRYMAGWACLSSADTAAGLANILSSKPEASNNISKNTI
jgi:tRNA dimethylallyltransferase